MAFDTYGCKKTLILVFLFLSFFPILLRQMVSSQLKPKCEPLIRIQTANILIDWAFRIDEQSKNKSPYQLSVCPHAYRVHNRTRKYVPATAYYEWNFTILKAPTPAHRENEKKIRLSDSRSSFEWKNSHSPMERKKLYSLIGLSNSFRFHQSKEIFLFVARSLFPGTKPLALHSKLHFRLSWNQNEHFIYIFHSFFSFVRLLLYVLNAFPYTHFTDIYTDDFSTFRSTEYQTKRLDAQTVWFANSSRTDVRTNH